MSKPIKIDRIAKSYGKVPALATTSISLRAGEFVSIVGPSGCGKSTLLRIIAGLDAATAGQVLIAGRRVDGPETDLGIVFQSPVLLDWRTVLSNVMIQAESRKLPRERTLASAHELLTAAGLQDFVGAYPFQLSGGMAQRVSVCRALVHKPSLLLMDEPFGALDSLTRDQMMLDLQRLWVRSRPTVVFVTHSVQEAVFLSDRIVVMAPRPGRVQAEVAVTLDRPRRLALRKTLEFNDIVDRVTSEFQKLGVIRDEDPPFERS